VIFNFDQMDSCRRTEKKEEKGSGLVIGELQVGQALVYDLYGELAING
jgi:hypothetical protein